jgi:hypothetical protein
MLSTLRWLWAPREHFDFNAVIAGSSPARLTLNPDKGPGQNVWPRPGQSIRVSNSTLS